MKLEQTWEECKDYLSRQMPSPLFETFIRPINIASSSANQIQLDTPANVDSRLHIESRYLPLIRKFLTSNNFQGQVSLGHRNSDSDSLSEITTLTNQQSNIIKNKLSQGTRFHAARENVMMVQSLLSGKSSRLMIVSGPSGSGKTHLGKQLVHTYEHNGLGSRYLSLETFLSEFSLACKKRDTVKWRNTLRANQCLVIDDFHYLKSTALRAGEELQNLIDDYQQQGRYLILLSSSSVGRLKLPQGLQSRLLSLCDLQLEYPQTDQRKYILQDALNLQNIALTDDLLLYIVERISRDMRLLKSVADRLMGWGFTDDHALLTRERLDGMLGDLYTIDECIEPQKVLLIVSEFYRLSVDEITGKARHRGVSMARHLVAWLCTEELNMGQKEVARLIGRSDHGTVIHARKKVAQMLKTDLFFARQVSQLKQQLYQP